jgi:hypothetical protein
MLDNSFLKDFNGTFYKYITQDGEIGYIRDIQTVPDLISLVKVDNLHLFSNLVDLASIYNVETRVITNGEKVVGGIFTIFDSSIILRVSCILQNDRIVAFVESSSSSKKYIDLASIEDSQRIIQSCLS